MAAVFAYVFDPLEGTGHASQWDWNIFGMVCGLNQNQEMGPPAVAESTTSPKEPVKHPHF